MYQMAFVFKKSSGSRLEIYSVIKPPSGDLQFTGGDATASPRAGVASPATFKASGFEWFLNLSNRPDLL